MTLSTTYLILAEAIHRRRARTLREVHRRSNQRLAVLAARPQEGGLGSRPPIAIPALPPAPTRTEGRGDIIDQAVAEVLNAGGWGPGRDQNYLTQVEP